MKKYMIACFLLMCPFPAYSQTPVIEFYYPGFGWWSNDRMPNSNYTLGTYQYYGGGMFGNSYYGPTPFQRYSYGVYNDARIRVGPNSNFNRGYSNYERRHK